MKITRPDEKRASAYAEHVISVLVLQKKADENIGSDATLKKILANWLISLFEVLPEELGDTLRFLEIAHEHQRVANRLWDPILLPFAAMYLTGDDQLPDQIYSEYWAVASAPRTEVFFKQLPLEKIASQIPMQGGSTFTADMMQLTHTLLTDYYESSFRLDLTREDPVKFADHLFANWENIWEVFAEIDAQAMDAITMKLYYLLRELGFLLAHDISSDFAKQVTSQIEERTKHGWHGFYPKIDA